MAVFRLNTEDLLSDYRIELVLSQDGRLSGFIRDQVGRDFDLSRPSVAWYRKPDLDFRNSGYAPEFHGLAKAEARAILDVIYSLPQITWFISPRRALQSKSKIQQLLFAAAQGIAIPETVLSNLPESAEELQRSTGGDLVTKAIYTANVDINGVNAGIPTTKITKEDIRKHRNRIRLCPTVFQPNIAKAFEVRVTIIGKRIFAIRIDSQDHDETRTDWRVRSDLCRHTNMVLPKRIEDFCLSFLDHFGLNYGAMDFIVRDSGEYIFLENNPYGQYLWLELETGVPITKSILEYLAALRDKSGGT